MEIMEFSKPTLFFRFAFLGFLMLRTMSNFFFFSNFVWVFEKSTLLFGFDFAVKEGICGVLGARVLALSSIN